MAQEFDEYNSSEIDFTFGCDLTRPGSEWKEWIKILGLSEREVKEIEKNRYRVSDERSEIDKLNALAKLSAVTTHAKHYAEGIDSILSTNLNQPISLEDRVRLWVWRFILKANERRSPKEEWQVRRNREILSKIDVIDSLLDEASDEPQDSESRRGKMFFDDEALELDSYLDQSQIANLWADTEKHRELMDRYRATIREAFIDDEHVQYPEELKEAVYTHHKHYEQNLEKIEQAVKDGNLKAIVEIHKPGFDDGFEEITDKNRIRKIKNGHLNKTFIRITVHRNDFQEWLKQSGQWPLPEGCLLVKWFEGIIKSDNNSQNQVTHPTKKRTRKTNLTHAIKLAAETLAKALGRKPSFDELWQYFQDNRDDTGIIQDFTDTHLTWVDTKGKFHDTQKETIANHLARIKNVTV